MDYSKEIKELQDAVKELKQIKDFLFTVEETAIAIENKVSGIDAVIPTDLHAIADPKEREQASHASDLLTEAFGLVDEILGPPEDEATGSPVGTAFSPEAKGNSPKEISLDEILKKMASGKNHAS